MSAMEERKEREVLVLATRDYRGLPVLEEIRQEARIRVACTVEDARPHISKAEIVFAAEHDCYRLLRDLWPQSRSLRWVQCASAGVDALLFPELAESQVILTNGAGLYSRPLAEFVMAAILATTKQLERLRTDQQEKRWEPFEMAELFGQTLGIVGTGDVGRSVARLASAFQMRLLGCKRSPGPVPGIDFEKIYAPRELRTMLTESDWVVLAVPLTSQTRGLMGERELHSMKRTGTLINIARGPVVQESALIRALQEKSIQGAILDVFEQEPLPRESPLWQMGNVIISPHCADNTSDMEARSGRLFVRNLRLYTAGKPLVNVVDKRAGY